MEVPVAELGDFSKRIAVLAASLEEGVHRTVRKAALAADQAIVLATPVDTGRARANWVVSINAPAAGEQPTPASPAAGAAQALGQGQEEIGRYGTSSSHSAIHITNNLPYIGRLNAGSSAQAPAGFVEEAVQAAVAAVRGTKVLGPEG